jgi:tRNA nucleotidyltransferase (CCA-adding enzyme)
MAGRRWEHFEHGADIGIRGYGPTVAAAFEETALAMIAAIVDPGKVTPVAEVHIRCEAPDVDILLVDWLNAVVYEMATRHMVFGRFQVCIDDGGLTATAAGERWDRRRHAPAVEVKGATFTALKVAPSGDGWMAQCVVDV